MKKIMILVMLTMASFYYANAQQNCDLPCAAGPVQTKTYVLCYYNWSGYINDCCTPPPGVPEVILNAPCKFVIIDFHTVVCGGVTSLLIDDVVYVDNTDYWDNHVFDPFMATAHPTLVHNTTPCTYTGSALQAVKDAVNNLVVSIGIHTDIDVKFKGACFSLVTLAFPDGAFTVGAPNDLGVRDTTHFSSGSRVTQSIPCSDVCCTVKYQYQIITAENGETTEKWEPISYEGDDNNCKNSPLPDYNNFANKLTAQVLDPLTGTYTTVTGTVVDQGSCQLICSNFMAPPPPSIMLSTDILPKEIPLAFSAFPTLANSVIHFTSSKSIQKIVVYDVVGNEALSVIKLENSELNISGLKNGIYYLQVYFPNNDVKTIKILKQ